LRKEGKMEFLFVIFGAGLLGALAVAGGADTRDGRDWHHHSEI
jgi:hypothetical protein